MKQSTVDRVARAICRLRGQNPDGAVYFKNTGWAEMGPQWMEMRPEAMALLDVLMQEGIECHEA